MSSRRWTDAEDQYLIEHRDEPYEVIARALDRTAYAVNARVNKHLRPHGLIRDQEPHPDDPSTLDTLLRDYATAFRPASARSYTLEELRLIADTARTKREVAVDLGTSIAAIDNEIKRMKRHGITIQRFRSKEKLKRSLPHGPIGPRRRTEAIIGALYVGRTRAEIADEYGITESAVGQIAKKYGLDKRDPVRQRPPRKTLPQPPPRSVAPSLRQRQSATEREAREQGQPWYAEDDRQLREWFEAGMPAYEIATRMDRTLKGVQTRIARLQALGKLRHRRKGQRLA